MSEDVRDSSKPAVSSASNDDPDKPITRREFDQFREHLAGQFVVVNTGISESQQCFRRLENKVDELMAKVYPLFADYERRIKEEDQRIQRRSKMWMIGFAAALSVASSVATAIIIYLLAFLPR